MVSHDVLRDCAHHALTEWQHAEYKGNWHPLPAAEDVWEGRWLTGFHFQVACPGGGVSNCHPFFVKVNASLPKGMFVDNKAPECSWSTSKRYAVEIAKELRRRGTPVVGVWLVTKNGRKLVYGSAQSKQFPNHLPFKIVGQPDIRCPVTTPEGVGDCFYPITTQRELVLQSLRNPRREEGSAVDRGDGARRRAAGGYFARHGARPAH